MRNQLGELVVAARHRKLLGSVRASLGLLDSLPSANPRRSTNLFAEIVISPLPVEVAAVVPRAAPFPTVIVRNIRVIRKCGQEEMKPFASNDFAFSMNRVLQSARRCALFAHPNATPSRGNQFQFEPRHNHLLHQLIHQIIFPLQKLIPLIFRNL